MVVSSFRNGPLTRAFFALAVFLALQASSAAQEVQVYDLGDSIKAGMVSFEGARGTGASSGAAVNCVLRNLTDSAIYVDVFIRGGIFLDNGGYGQDMLAAAVFLSDGSYSAYQDRSFVTIEKGKGVDAVLMAFCADFDKENPAPSEAFTIAEVPAGLKPVARAVEKHLRESPQSDRIVAMQVAVWLAQGLKPDYILRKFEFSVDDEDLARSFLK